MLALVAGVWCVILQSRLVKLQQQFAELEKGLSSLKSGAIGMGQRILAMEKSGSAAGSNLQEDIPLANRPYSEATHLLEMGVSREEVASRCGLSRAEASLLDALRKKPTA